MPGLGRDTSRRRFAPRSTSTARGDALKMRAVHGVDVDPADGL